MNNLKTIILAAGEGKRMKSNIPKVLHKILNKTMIDYVIEQAINFGSEEICIITGHKSKEVESSIKNKDLKFVKQNEQLGTGHAVMQAEQFIDENKDIIILYGDTPLITAETIKKLIEFHREKDNDCTIISSIVDDPKGFGHIIRDDNGIFVKNIEHKDANDEEKLINEINTGIYCFKGSVLKKYLNKITNNNSQNEYYLPDIFEIIISDNGKVDAMKTYDFTEFFGVNSKLQLSKAIEIMKNRINNKLMKNGVTIIDPQNTYIDCDVSIGSDTIIYPNCFIEGNTVIGEYCEIGPNSRITNMIIGNEVKLQSSTVVDSKIGDRTTVGPYAYIRPNSNIGEDVKVGDFVEVKNSNISNKTKISHLTYVGDTDCGKNVNFGCGTVTVNYDGKNKFRTTIEDNVFIGCNANLVAPVEIKKNSYIAAGSTITNDVPENVLAIARTKQKVIEGWIKK